MNYNTAVFALARISILIPIFAIITALGAIPAWPQSLAPSKFVIERVVNLDAANTPHAIYPSGTGIQPARGVPFIQAETGARITRITDTNDIVPQPNLNTGLPWLIDGNPAAGYYNGYSRWTNVNVTGEYMVAFRTNAHSSLYRLADCAYLGPLTPDRYNAIGESSEIRWDRSGQPGTQTRIYYHDGSRFYQQDALLGWPSAELLYTFPAPITSTGDMDCSDDTRWWALRLTDGTSVVFDKVQRRVLPGVIPQAPTGLDISPSGKWMAIVDGSTNPFLRFRFYRISDLELGDTSKPVYLPTLSAGHNGWAYDQNGDEVVVYQDNTNDWFCAFNPETRRITQIINLRELGWGCNQHIARITNKTKKGWTLMSTYSRDESVWSYNQLLMIEILPYTLRPRIWRICSTYTRHWLNGVDIGGYFSEAFASIDNDGNNIYWGGNWMGTDNLEIYRVELPANWDQVLAGTTPVPTPDPNPQPGGIPPGPAAASNWTIYE